MPSQSQSQHGLVYDLPKTQLINADFTEKVACTTGDSPYSNPNVISNDAQSSSTPASQKYYEIQIQFNQNTYFIYQNVETGGFVYVSSASTGTNVVESTTATLWAKSSVDGYPGTALQAITGSSIDQLYWQLPKDATYDAMVLTPDNTAMGARWTVADADNN